MNGKIVNNAYRGVISRSQVRYDRAVQYA